MLFVYRHTEALFGSVRVLLLDRNMFLVYLIFVGAWFQTPFKMSTFALDISIEKANLANRFIHLKHEIRNREIARLNTRIKLNSRVAELESELKSDIKQFDKRIKDLKHLREANLHIIRHLTETLRKLKYDNAVLKTKRDNKALTTEDLVSDSMDGARSVITRSGSSEATVAFHAALYSQLTDPGVTQAIPFNKTITDVGAQFSNRSGIFTCEQAGVYVFYWEVLLEGSNYIITDLAKNGKGVGSAEVGSSLYTISGSSTVIVELQHGDEVTVRVVSRSPGTDVLPTLTMFAGFRLP